MHDSGIGTSLPTAILSSVVSSIAGGRRAKFPPLSPQALAGDSFECDGCGKQLIITKPDRWK